ncbi:methylated-DNA--[protein]-cysteine S-methyltransferase [Actinomadura oligospora]|uniref:methylated-DNA--[protein]-cysteine S-methyltransferase n=1 Tax=Actinomadura oligospora TaxID=111804 RepID=UPI00047D633A|nr:methylated-DNA--[protein]-cysteine S-methyltransferase [Actinomadura oligospora]
MTVYTTIDSPLGELLLVGEESPTAVDGTALTSLSVPGQRNGAVIQNGWIRKPEAFTHIAAQLDAYFAGELTRFDIEYTTGGSDFQRRVWAALDDIPFGATVSYGAVAVRCGASASAVRAVASAIGANPLLVVRPCHRVIRSDGSLSGYAGGPERKQQLLDLETVHQPA